MSMSKDVIPLNRGKKRKKRKKERSNPKSKLQDVKHSQHAKNHGGEKVDLETLNQSLPEEMILRRDGFLPRDNL